MRARRGEPARPAPRRAPVPRSGPARRKSRARRVAAAPAAALVLTLALAPVAPAEEVAAQRSTPAARQSRSAAQRPEYHVDVTAPQHDAFGFRVGEQRRYARGPQRIFRAGEFEIWTMRLDEIHNADNGMPLYTFTYGREVSLINPGDPGRMDHLRATMSVTVNHYGFPVKIRYGGDSLEESTTDFVNKHGRLRWIGNAYLFRAPDYGEEFSFNFALPENDALEPAIPSGVFVSETENPALITIPAAVFQALGLTDMEYLSLRPNRIGRQQVRRPRRPGDPSYRNDVVRGRLEFKETGTIEVGGRDYEAIKLESADSDEDVWIRDDGALLLMTARFRNWNGHIRLLHPSEY